MIRPARDFSRGCRSLRQSVTAAARRVTTLSQRKYRHKLLSALASAALLLALPSPADETLDARWKELGIDREELPPAQNPVAEFIDLLETIPDDLRDKFSDGSQARPFNRYKPDERTAQRCMELQNAARKIIAKGPGQIPHQNEEWLPHDSVFLWRANSVLATDALERGLPGAAANHLAFNFETAHFILRSEPALMDFVIFHSLCKRAYEDLFTLYLANPNKARLEQIAKLHDKFRFQRSFLADLLRGESRFTLGVLEDLPARLREEYEDLAEAIQDDPWDNMAEPLRSCSLEDVLAMKYNISATRSDFLDQVSAHAEWIQSGLPASQHPHYTEPKPAPRDLDYYKSAPNGLNEIFEDCNGSDNPFLSSALDALTHAVFMDVAIAWLRAEADGLDVTSLADLVPKYLAAIPTHPADGKPLRCLPEKRTLYSVGPDLHDDGGRDDLPEPADGEDPDFDATTDRVFVVPKAENK